MRMIEIVPLANGAHRNQSGNFINVPEGWAVIPPDMALPDTFPFVNIEVDEQIVTSMTTGIIPKQQLRPKSQSEPTDAEILNVFLGVSK